jgi:uncharacterized membrane-anchored protein YhcB (DUF1043 family)
MEPMSIVLVGAAAIIGILVGNFLAKGKINTLSDRINELEDARDTAQKQLKEGQQELDSASKKATELDSALSKSKKSLKDAESAKKKHLEEARQFEKQAAANESQAKAAESKAQEVGAQARELAKEAAAKSEKVSQLEEDLKRAGSGNIASYDSVQGDLDGILQVLCEHESQEAAVIADANGIVVAAYGDPNIKEGMAAAANRITKIGDQLTGMVEFAGVSTFRLSDSGDKVISGRTFDIGGEMISLATVGASMPSDGSLDGAMRSLSAVLN